jgi:hypothetical protein
VNSPSAECGNREHREDAARNGPLALDAAIDWNDVHWTPLTAEPRRADDRADAERSAGKVDPPERCFAPRF